MKSTSATRREFGTASLAAAAMVMTGARIGRADNDVKKKFQCHAWERDAHNPILPPGGFEWDVTCCMNPFVLRRGDEYWLYYAGGDKGQAADLSGDCEGRRSFEMGTERSAV